MSLAIKSSRTISLLITDGNQCETQVYKLFQDFQFVIILHGSQIHMLADIVLVGFFMDCSNCQSY